MTYYFNREDYKAHDELLEQVSQLAKDPKMGYWFKLVHHCRYFSLFARGEYEQCNRHCQEILEIFDPSLPFPWELVATGYLEIHAKAWWMSSLQVSGYMDQAKALFDRHLAFAKEHRDSATLYHIYTFSSVYCLFTREWKAAETIMEEYLPIVREFGDPIFIITAEFYYYIARGYQGDRAALEKVLALVSVCIDVGFIAFAATMSSWVGELHYHFGEYQSGLAWVERYLAHVYKTGTHMHTAELLRVKGLNLLKLGRPDSIVEESFTQALERSRKQSAKTFELRAARDLARLWKTQGKTKEGYDLLKGLYDWFTEGFDSIDLREAKALLSELDTANLVE